MSGSIACYYTNEEIVANINVLAKEMWPYIQNEKYDNGHVLGRNVFQFYSKAAQEKNSKDGIIFGTVIHAELQQHPTQICITIKTLYNGQVILPVTKERAADIMLKMKSAKKYIDFILEKYQESLIQAK